VLSNFHKMWLTHPEYEGARAIPSPAFKTKIGGAASTLGANTCCLRLSWTLNRCGHPIPAQFPGVAIYRGGRKADEYYIAAVSQMIRYLDAVYGKSLQAVATGPHGFNEPPKHFRQAGILVFWWGGPLPQGHVDLWDGEICCGHKHEIYPSKGGAAGMGTAAKRMPSIDRDRLICSHWYNAKKLHLWPAVMAGPVEVPKSAGLLLQIQEHKRSILQSPRYP
jgi:hypothetical protein